MSRGRERRTPMTFNLTTAAPTVAITSAGGTVAQAAQTISGTVDVADAGSTVKIFDGTAQVGTAVVGSDGNWSTKVTLAHTGANVLTATDANVAGTGTSNAVTFNLTTAAPTVAITSAGGTVAQAAQTIIGHGRCRGRRLDGEDVRRNGAGRDGGGRFGRKPGRPR